MVIQKVDREPVFNLWVKHVLRKQYRIVAKVRKHGAKKYVKTKMKFVIEYLKTVDQALELDKKNGSTLLANAITKEMNNVGVAFGIWEKGDPQPVGYQFINCDMIFDVNMEDLL